MEFVDLFTGCNLFTGCVGVHAVSGAWSLLTVGLFAKEDELSAALGIHHNHAGLFYVGI